MAAFLRKWSCDVALRHLVLYVKSEAIGNHVSPWRAFTVCAAADDMWAASTVLRICEFISWEDALPEDFDENEKEWRLHGDDSPLASRIPLFIYTDCPPAYPFALTRALTERPMRLETPTVLGYEYSEDFERWFHMAKGSRPTQEVCFDLPDKM